MRPRRDRRAPETIARHLEDAAHFPGGHADGVARPRNESEVAELLAGAASVLPVGAQSSVTGGATPNGGMILSTDRLTRIDGAGTKSRPRRRRRSARALQQFLSARGQWFPPVPTFMGAFVGGAIATNARGCCDLQVRHHPGVGRWPHGRACVRRCPRHRARRRAERRRWFSSCARTGRDREAWHVSIAGRSEVFGRIFRGARHGSDRSVHRR